MLKKINYIFLFSLLVYIPLGRFFQCFLESHFALSPAQNFWLAHWYEPVLVTLFMITFVWSLFKLKFKLNFKSETFFLLLFLALGLASIFFVSESVSRGIEGFRFVLLPFMVYCFALTTNLEKGQYEKLKKIYLVVALFVAVWAIVERFLPPNYWHLFHILNSNTPYWFGSHTTGSILQSVSLVGGPNQLASYLLPAFFLYYIDPEKKQPIYVLFFLITFVAIILTFSRSAWLGLAFGVILYEYFIQPDESRRKFSILLTIAITVLLISGYLLGGEAVRSLFTHGASQAGHTSSMVQTVNLIKESNSNQLLLGHGLGSVGPASMKYLSGFVPENWYLEMFLSCGLIGIILLLIVFYNALKVLFIGKNFGLALGLVGLLVCSLFLPTLSDNPAITFTIFVLVGVFSNSFRKG